MHRKGKLLLLVLGGLGLLGGLLVWRAVHYGFSAHDKPTRIEASIARTMRHWSTPADLRSARNPLPLTPQLLAASRAHWADHCASCHGNDGKGKTVIGEHLYPRAPDMTLAATQSLSDGELFSIIENGVRLTGMPGWGNGTAESAYGSWGLVHFVRNLPRLTPEEIGEMEELNPKSAEEWAEQQSEEDFLSGGSEERPTSATHKHSSEHLQ